MEKIDKCRDCGFLALRNSETNRLDEVPQFVRDGRPFIHRWAGPICYIRALPITEEFKTQAEQVKNQNEFQSQKKHWRWKIFKSVIDVDRKCEKARKYLPEYTPREHYE
ncbi:MAG TPA: hypothetical protein VMJ32_05830, partial [Pirellulales bacterium]|nr:hypothetical protein [Pirellulales bacterium]